MNIKRRLEILSKCSTWQNEFPGMSIKDCFFALHNDRDINKSELNYLMDWNKLN